MRAIVVVAEEGRLAAVAALGHVVGHAPHDDASESRHAVILPPGGCAVKGSAHPARLGEPPLELNIMSP
jgi:hypothetical protein